MRKLTITITAILITILSLIGCKVKTSNTTGDWYHKISKNMGGFNISSETKLTIIRIEAGVYEYRTEETVIDEMYGGMPKTNYSSGKFEKSISRFDHKWEFSGGEFDGGWIQIPADEWDDYKPTTISVCFPEGEGNTRVFAREL